MAKEGIGTVLKSAFAYTFYILLYTLLLPLLLLRLLWRSRRAPAYRQRWWQRLGWVAAAPPGGIWLHAVSVGEVVAAAPLLRALQAQHLSLAITVTTTTPTGAARLRQLFGDILHKDTLHGGTLRSCYSPYDWPPALALFLSRIRPQLMVVMETELWPVTIAACRLLDIPVVLANGRLSQNSAAGYARLSWLVEPMLRWLHVTAQHDSDGRRFLDLGLPPSQLQVTGSVKYDIAIDAAQRAAAAEQRQRFNTAEKSFVWIAASTHAGEDEIILSAHRQLLLQNPSALLVLVPRHPERFDAVAEKIAAADMRFSRRSRNSLEPDDSVFLLDSMGELPIFYGVCDIALVGGSLVSVGGHNCLEPAAWSKPVLSGPHVHNFAEITADLRDIGALQIVATADEIAAALQEAASHPDSAAAAGAAGERLLQQRSGATATQLAFINQKLDG